MRKPMKFHVINTGGTLGMVGKPLVPAASAEELLEGIKVPKGVKLNLQDMDEKQDSTNVWNADRLVMGQMIEAAYETHDAFIVLHGTDSLAETCSYLSMLFKLSLQKPVFVIGAQMTKIEAGSDVAMQIENALRVAKSFVKNSIVGVYNVCIGEVLHGARVCKRRDSAFDAFHTPGVHPVAHAFPHIMIKEGVRRKDEVTAVQGLRLDSKFERHVVSLVVSADAPPYVLMDMVKAGRIRGVVLECKGAGNIPDRPWETEGDDAFSWIDAIRAATDAGIHVGIVSPFEDGRVILDRYGLGAKAKAAGALSLESMTPPMADTKFRQAIAMFPKDPARIQRFLSADMLNELLDGFEDESDEDDDEVVKD
ncbi:hypothetical protein C0581_01685 [Candidatus Parcubacteria bacterium]|nr:MAG: hypothetical protein C0581_01685 [Candidatus Parcubacteria bacterium]